MYKAYLKRLGMLTPRGELLVQIESERFLWVGSGTSDFLYCSPVDGLNYGADGIGSLGQRVSLPAIRLVCRDHR